MKTKLKILHLEDSPADAQLVERELKKGKIQFEKLVVDNKTAFVKALKEFAPDIILANHTLPSFDSKEAIEIIKQKEIKIPFILVTATVSDQYAVEIMKAGANDYILKDSLNCLPHAVLSAIEKNKAENQLFESEAFNKGVLSSLSSHITVIDKSGTLIAVNKAWDDFAKENGETSLSSVSIGSNYFDVCKRAVENGDNDAAHALAGIQSVFKNEKQYFEMEYPCHSPEQQRWFILSVKNFGNDTHQVVISHQNITERKIAENNLSKTSVDLQKTVSELNTILTEKKRLEKAFEVERQRFLDLYFQAPSCMGILKGPDYVFEMANPLYLQLIDKKNIIGKTVKEVLPELESQGIFEFLDSVYYTGKTFSANEMLVKFDLHGTGELVDRYLNFIYQAHRNRDGEIDGIFFFVNDITEQILSRKELEKSEKFFKGVIENSADMITLTDPVGKTIYASPAVSKNFGYTYKECLDINIADIVHPDDALIMQEFVMKIMMHPGVPIEAPLIRFRKKDGSYIWVEGTFTNFHETEGINAIIANFRDITERKKADAENRFRAKLLNTIGQAAIATDLNGIVNYWNRAAENIYGWTKKEALGKHIIDLTTSKATNEQATQIMEELKNGQTWSGEFKVRKKDGTYFPALITNSPIYDEHNLLHGIIGISSDITEMKKLEELLDKTNRLASIGSWEIDVVKGTVFWSDITKEIREVDKDYVPRLDVGISYFEEGIHKETISKKVQECIEYGTPWDEELKIITFKGNRKWVRTIGEGEFLKGKCLRIHGSFQDITVRKQAEQSLQQSESNLQAIIENTDATIYSLDTELRFIAFNNRLCNLVKEAYGIELKIGDNAFSFLEKLEPEESKRWNEIYSKALKGKTLKFEKEFNIGDVYNCSSFTIYPIWSNKTIIGLSCFIYDITNQKQEQRVKDKMAADLIQRNRDLEQFTYIISHNLRAPTANIIGFTEILQDETLIPKEKKELLQGLSKSVTALDSVIKDINDILQVKNDINEQKEVIFFSKLVNDIILSIGNLIHKNRVRIISDFSEVDEIYSLKVYMFSVFYNLISNSIKYRNPNEQPLIEIKSKKEDGKIILTFKDNGLGIDMKTQGNKIFGLYRRFHSHVEGKGMGLFMVKTQVESLGGKITIASELNKGAEFTIEFEI